MLVTAQAHVMIASAMPRLRGLQHARYESLSGGRPSRHTRLCHDRSWAGHPFSKSCVVEAWMAAPSSI